MRWLGGFVGPLLAVAAVWVAHACLTAPPQGGELRWWRGNTHTHTLWSDGDGAPELVAAWYREQGYDFLVLSDHNLLSTGERWFPVEPDGRLTPARLAALVERFGADAVETRATEAGSEMRLATLGELRERFEVPGEFVFLQGEEISDSFEGAPIHVNGLHLLESIEPRGGSSVRDVLQRNVAAVAEQGRRLGRPTLAHVNHPNFGRGISWEDLAALREDRFFEVFNGHPAVRNEGDAEHLATELLWDRALTRRLTELDLGLLYGIASDDAHRYHEAGSGLATAGRGWVVVRARALAPEAIVTAMRRGDFYSSSGVRLEDFGVRDESLRVDLLAEPGVRYATRFIGTRLPPGGAPEVGVLLAESGDDPAVYGFRGDELYVRAVVVSDRLHPNPYAEGQVEKAWIQPVPGPAAER